MPVAAGAASRCATSRMLLHAVVVVHLMALHGVADRLEDFEALKKWIKDADGFIDWRQEMSTGPNPEKKLWGIHATHDIPEESTLLRLPTSRMLGPLKRCDLVKRILQEMRLEANSDFYPYMKLMEGHKITVPSVWTKEELGYLNGLPQFDAGDGKEHWFHFTTWLKDDSCFPELRGTNGRQAEEKEMAEIMRASLLMTARANQCMGEECMTPFYDMYNHGSGRKHNTRVVFNETGSWVIASKNISSGDEIYNSYSKPNTHAVFRNWGFVEPYPQHWKMEWNEQGKFSFGIDDDGKILWSCGAAGIAEYEEKASQVLKNLQDADQTITLEAAEHTQDLVKAYRKFYFPDSTAEDIRALATQFREAYADAVQLSLAELRRDPERQNSGKQKEIFISSLVEAPREDGRHRARVVKEPVSCGFVVQWEDGTPADNRFRPHWMLKVIHEEVAATLVHIPIRNPYDRGLFLFWRDSQGQDHDRGFWPSRYTKELGTFRGHVFVWRETQDPASEEVEVFFINVPPDVKPQVAHRERQQEL